VRSIFVGSTGNEPGQALAAWALAMRLTEKGMRVGVLKPYGLLGKSPSPPKPLSDADVVLLKVALNLEEDEEILCPVMLKEGSAAEESADPGQKQLERIDEAFQQIARGKDVVLVLGGKEIFLGGELSGPSDSVLVKRFQASVLLTDRYQSDNLTLYSILSLNSFLEGRVKSVIVNHVSPDKLPHVKAKVIPFLREKGMTSAVAVAEDPILSAFTIGGIADWVEGRILCCPEGSGNLITNFTIGSKSLDGPLSLFKQIYNKILLVRLPGGEKGAHPIGGIILTGGKPPGEIILRIAAERAIPLILSSMDTFQVMGRLEKARPSLTARDTFKARRFLQLLDEEEEKGGWAESLL
jgi:uncharacterized protein